MRTEKIYGGLPVDLGLVDISPVEQMVWLYCPVKTPKMLDLIIPPNLRQFHPLITAAMSDCVERQYDSYVYITAKTLWVTPENPGNRPGWHSDGFLTDDLNYIWSNGNPTVFWAREGSRVSFAADHSVSMDEMESLCENDRGSQFTLSVKHLLRLDQTVLHKVGPVAKAGMRTFVKISVSKEVYALDGNSINHSLSIADVYQPRSQERNNPAGKVRAS